MVLFLCSAMVEKVDYLNESAQSTLLTATWVLKIDRLINNNNCRDSR